jgi:hypothetical protein
MSQGKRIEFYHDSISLFKHNISVIDSIKIDSTNNNIIINQKNNSRTIGINEVDSIIFSTSNAIYPYPFGQEASNITAEIIINTNDSINLDSINIEIPHLKYNKSWLFTLTQDDCLNSAFHQTWTAINGKPLSNYTNSNDQKQNSYSIGQLLAGDFPPESYYLGKTLGTTDGTGKEVRFRFTATVYPEGWYMNDPETINPGYTNNYYRFMKYYLTWPNVREMVNYDNSIAFHDVNAIDVHNITDIYNHYLIVQDSIKLHLQNRGCKVLAEPNGNKDYVRAAYNYNSIQTMTAQNDSDSIFSRELYPYTIDTNDLYKVLIKRYFIEPADIRSRVLTELQKPKEEREAVNIGVHSTDSSWVSLLLWLNDNYGKDGNDSLWFPSLEEYYEYNYYRIHSTITKTQINDSTIKITINIPSGEYFYYPSLTLNVGGIINSQIQNITSNNAITGLSYANYNNKLMINIDCRKFLLEHAIHYVEQYEENNIPSNKADALYFTNQLKDTPEKTTLLNRINH